MFLYVVVPGQLIAIVLGLLSLIARYRRGEGVERQQIKVLLWVGAVAVIFFSVDTQGVGGPIWLGSVLNVVFSIFVGAAVTLAVLRYRLFEIDRLISRTVTYAVLAGALALVYGFGAVWLPSRIVGEQTPLFVAGSTLAVAGLFNPLRRLVMRWVDRRFNRSSYDFEQITDRFAARLRDQVDADRLADDWAAVVTRLCSHRQSAYGFARRLPDEVATLARSGDGVRGPGDIRRRGHTRHGEPKPTR